MKSDIEDKIIEKYYNIVIQDGLYSTKKRLNFYLNFIFDRANFVDKKMLDIGAGKGLFSFYAACKGAKRVVSIEPQAEGSKSDSIKKFEKILAELNLIETIQLEKTTFQNFQSDNDKFDIILLHDSINHLDEKACINLQYDSYAIKKYNKIFQKLSCLANKGTKLIIVDCSRYSIFSKFNFKNPFSPSIEWHKHQSPEYWAKLLLNFGFVSTDIRWISPPILNSVGKIFLSNKVAAYFTGSGFCLTMEKN